MEHARENRYSDPLHGSLTGANIERRGGLPAITPESPGIAPRSYCDHQKQLESWRPGGQVHRGVLVFGMVTARRRVLRIPRLKTRQTAPLRGEPMARLPIGGGHG